MTEESSAKSPSGDAERQRRRSIVILSGLGGFLLIAFLIAFAVVQGWIPTSSPGQQAASPAASPAATPTCTAPSLPQASGITVNVYNSTDRAGLAGSTAGTLREHGFAVAEVGNDPLGKQVAGVAEIRYGGAGATNAQALQLRFPGAAMIQDDRSGEVVDVAVGAGFTQVAPATAAATPTAGEGTSSC